MLVEETYPPQDWAARASAVQVALKSSASMESVAFRMIFRPSWGSRSALFCTASDRSEVRPLGGGSAASCGICLGRAVHRGIRSTAAAVLLAAPPHPAREAASASEKRILNNVFFIEFPSFLCQVLLLYIRRTSRRYCVGTMSNRYQICNKRVFFGVRTRGREKNMLYWNT